MYGCDLIPESGNLFGQGNFGPNWNNYGSLSEL
jgi:hypothetical protein